MSIKKSICFLIVLTAITCAQAFTAGNGTPENPYQILTQADLEAVNNRLDANYILINDIDLSGTTYTQAVIATNTGTEFTGSFNGNSFKIQNLTINDGSNKHIALFGYIGSAGYVKNLGVEDCNIAGDYHVGGLCGVNHGKISNCCSTGQVTGNNTVGGLCGYNYHGTISNCYSTGVVTGSGVYIGGLCGCNAGTISNCYSTGQVTGTGSDVGGLCGYNFYDKITSSFWDTETSGQLSSDGGTGKTTEQMQTQTTFTYAGWDFDDDWAFYVDSTGDGEYPLLKWQPRKSLVLTDNLDFGEVDVDASKDLNFTITNNGTLDINVSSITCPDGFTGEFNGNITPGTSQNIAIKFKPTKVKNYSGNITVNSDAVYGVKEIATEGVGSGGVISLTGSLDFGNVDFETSKTLDFMINNTGNADLVVTGITCPAGFTGDWRGSIAAGSSQQVPVTFNAAEVKNYKGTITVSSNAVEGINTIPCEAVGSGAIMSLSGDLNFGSVKFGESATQKLTISNIGNADLVVNEISYMFSSSFYFSGDFSGTIAAGSSKDVVVTFNPTKIGDITGFSIVGSNGVANDDKYFNCAGVGLGSDIYIGNSSLNFHDVRLGGSKSLDFTIYNYGNIDLDVSGISYPEGFSGDWSGIIAPSSSQQITATFTPTELKEYGYIPYFGGSGSVTTVIGGSSDYHPIIGPSSDDDSKEAKNVATNITVISDASEGDNYLYCEGKGIGGVIGVSGDTDIGLIRADQQYSSEFIITNSGNVDLVVSSILYPDCFSGDWSGTIPAGESQVVSVVIDPNAVGDFSGKVTVQCDMVAGSNSIYYEVYATNYYQIFTRIDLEAVNNDTYGIYDLMNDIDLSGIVYTNAVIEPKLYSKELWEKKKKDYGFSGLFNGNGHVISDLTIESVDPNNTAIGLFASIDNEYAKVTKLGLENVSITGNTGIVGSLCGGNEGNIINCYSTGLVTCSDLDGVTGGLCGYNVAVITNSYSACLVIHDVTNKDARRIGNRHGGFCGYDSGQITNCFWDIETSGQTGSYGGKGNTTAQMKDMNTFLDAGWNFSGYSADWFMPEDNYPVFGGFAGQPLRIDIVSMAMLADCWLQTDLVLDDPNNLCYQIDLNGDSTIKDDDLLAITNNWLGYHFWEDVVDFDDSDFNDDDSWTYGGMDEWLIVDGEGTNGSVCFKSDDVSYGQDADLDWVVDTTGFNTIGFDFKFDAWSNCVLTFYIDGVEAYSHSGAVDWTYIELPIPAAEHTLTWTFTRGFAFSYGENAAYLDNVILFNK